MALNQSRSLGGGGFRKQYDDLGVANYYHSVGNSYRNPHECEIVQALRVAFALEDEGSNGTVSRTRSKLARSWTSKYLWTLKPISEVRVLDLACGSGEVTLALRQLGWENIEGIDPFTGVAYRERTGGPVAAEYSFADISNGALEGNEYDVIVCSYALHLVPISWMQSLCVQLAMTAKFFVIISPHKLPVMKDEYGWSLIDAFVHERVHMRLFSSMYCQ